LLVSCLIRLGRFGKPKCTEQEMGKYPCPALEEDMEFRVVKDQGTAIMCRNAGQHVVCEKELQNFFSFIIAL